MVFTGGFFVRAHRLRAPVLRRRFHGIKETVNLQLKKSRPIAAIPLFIRGFAVIDHTVFTVGRGLASFGRLTSVFAL